ncbi:MAG: hypothetical protein IBX40_06485 [Methanosarcinales archaeon]|nr:hypothetical protein [Methanosarcinales archaeon]
MITIEVSAPVNPTEDLSKVQAAIENIFIGLEFQFQEREGMKTRLVGSGNHESLIKLHELIRNRKILDTARTNIRLEENIVTFLLNKQAAIVGKVSFPPGDEPLGSIWVEIVAQSPDEAMKVVDWLAPPTEEGTPKFEIEL